MVRVRIHGILKEEGGVEVVDVDGRYFDEVVGKLPEGVRKVLMKYSKYLIVLVNGRRVYDLDKIQLLPTDVVDLMIPVGGG
jgi:molybdopterin converting factor small subunit